MKLIKTLPDPWAFISFYFDHNDTEKRYLLVKVKILKLDFLLKIGLQNHHCLKINEKIV